MATLDDIDAARQQYTQPAQPATAQPDTTTPAPATTSGATLDDIDAARQAALQRQNITPPPTPPPPPTAGEAFRAGADHAIRSSAPFQWLYDNLPALKQGDQQAGYTPLTEQQYQARYGDNGFATTGGALMGGLVAAPAAVAAEAVGGPLATYAAGTRLLQTAPQVIRTLADGTQVLASPFVQQVARPAVGAMVRGVTNAVQGVAGAAATGGNLLTGAIGGAALPVAGKLLGDLGNSGAVQYLTNNKLVRGAAALGMSALGYEHGHSLWEALGGLGLGSGAQHYLGDVVPGLVNPLLRGIGAAAPYMAVPGGEAGGQVPIPGL